MKKMKTLFNQDERYKVISELRAENSFVLDGDYSVYRKRDGTSVMIEDNQMYRRYDANEKKGRKIPKGSIHCQTEPAPNGSFPVWVGVKSDEPSDKFHIQAFNQQKHWLDGTYELCGEKINGNKENIQGVKLIKHDSEEIKGLELTFDGVKEYLTDNVIEGLVIKDNKTGLMTKIRRKDYGMTW